MAYQEIATPRFYLNYFDWMFSKDIMPFSEETLQDSQYNLPYLKEKFRTLPVRTNIVPPSIKFNQSAMDNYFTGPHEQSFVAILGHDLKANYHVGENVSGLNWDLNLNGDITHYGLLAGREGFSISGFYGPPEEMVFLASGLHANAGSIIFGKWYDFPHACEVDVKVDITYDGVKASKTRGGSHLIYKKYLKSHPWGTRGAWELGGGEDKMLSKGGRRIWHLTFSYIDGRDLFPKYSTTNVFEFKTDWYSNVDELYHQDTLIQSTDFFSMVMQRTNGGQLPFIFQPDISNNNPDGFTICKVDPKSFKFSQITNGMYAFSLKVNEVW